MHQRGKDQKTWNKLQMHNSQAQLTSQNSKIIKMHTVDNWQHQTLKQMHNTLKQWIFKSQFNDFTQNKSHMSQLTTHKAQALV